VRHRLSGSVDGKHAFMREGEGAGLLEGLGCPQSGLRALRKFDESSPRWKDDEELLVVATLSALGL
jgi:hypothetical protein